jgi:hypothetical protein
VTLEGELVWSGYAGQPITYTWSADDQSAISHHGAGTTDSATFTWTAPGRRRITVTATDGIAAASATRDALVYAVSVSGPGQADTGKAVTFEAGVTPETWTRPITYTWEATDQTPITHAGRHAFDDSAAFTWRSGGTKTVTVTAHIGEAVMQAVHTLGIEGAALDKHLFMPMVTRQ